jgi:hypothetical protein
MYENEITKTRDEPIFQKLGATSKLLGARRVK